MSEPRSHRNPSSLAGAVYGVRDQANATANRTPPQSFLARPLGPGRAYRFTGHLDNPTGIEVPVTDWGDLGDDWDSVVHPGDAFATGIHTAEAWQASIHVNIEMLSWEPTDSTIFATMRWGWVTRDIASTHERTFVPTDMEARADHPNYQFLDRTLSSSGVGTTGPGPICVYCIDGLGQPSSFRITVEVGIHARVWDDSSFTS